MFDYGGCEIKSATGLPIVIHGRTDVYDETTKVPFQPFGFRTLQMLGV